MITDGLFTEQEIRIARSCGADVCKKDGLISLKFPNNETYEKWMKQTSNPLWPSLRVPAKNR